MVRALIASALILTLASLSPTASAQQAADAVAPEASSALALSGWGADMQPSLDAKSKGHPVTAQDWMISAANPYAVAAGARVLERSGTAADAMVAVQAVLGLVEPQSSGLGGGAFLVWYDGETGRLSTLDGRETAPLAASPRLFQDKEGKPLKFFDAVIGGRSVGVPGTPALLEAAHQKWGKTRWRNLFAEAITLAEEGFVVSPRLADLVARDAKRLASHPETAAYFLPGGTPLSAGQGLRNPAYGATLRTLADQGAGAFYALNDGTIGADIVDAVQRVPDNPGLLSRFDLALYQVREREPVCLPYKGYEICGMGPPSSGALAVGQILGLLRHHDISDPTSAETWRLIGDASRLAFADRGRYVADSDYVPVPVKGMLEPAYLRERAGLLNRDTALGKVTAGMPMFDHALNWADDDAIERPSTTHISIVDRYGNALSMTSTIENAFGSRVMVRGFLLNNELTDFSFRSHRDGVPVANRVEPGKRPRSSMAPTIVMKDGKPVLVIGSPGGSRIIGYVAQAIIAHLDWDMDVQQAVAMGHGVNRFGTFDLERDSPLAAQQDALEGMGFEVKLRTMNSGLHAIAITDQGLMGGADPRREGIAFGK